MNPLNIIEKWINEHGSAAILRDHVALLKEQIAASDRKQSVLETENATLKKTNAELKSENNDLRYHVEIAKVAKQPFPQPGLIHDFDKRVA